MFNEVLNVKMNYKKNEQFICDKFIIDEIYPGVETTDSDPADIG